MYGFEIEIDLVAYFVRIVFESVIYKTFVLKWIFQLLSCNQAGSKSDPRLSQDLMQVFLLWLIFLLRVDELSSHSYIGRDKKIFSLVF